MVEELFTVFILVLIPGLFGGGGEGGGSRAGALGGTALKSAALGAFSLRCFLAFLSSMGGGWKVCGWLCMAGGGS